MASIDLDEQLVERIAFVKRSCMLCKGRSRLRAVEPEKNKVREGLHNLVEFFNSQFNALRRKDAEAEEINNAIANKRLCMDLLEECEECSKEVDLVNRGLNKVKK